MLFTLDFDELNGAAAAGRWDVIAERLSEAGRRVEAAGAAFLMITTVTGHVVASEVEAALGIPLLHIADPTGEAIRAAGFSRVGLLATRFTMEKGFLIDRLSQHYGLQVLVPPQEQRDELHRIIIDELTLGTFADASRRRYLQMAHDLASRGAEAIIVGCTELPLLLAAEDYPLPAFDVTKLHAEAAIDLALAETAG